MPLPTIEHEAEDALSPVLQDYLEMIYQLQFTADQPVGFSASEASPYPETSRSGVRVTDIAAVLGTRLPTVVRSIARLRQLGLVEQAERGPVRLTARGAALAAQLAHRHADVVRFLAELLGVHPQRAEADACVMEHGLSAESAQRLHEFLERWDAVPAALRIELAGAAEAQPAPDFNLVGAAAGAGRRK